MSISLKLIFVVASLIAYSGCDNSSSERVAAPPDTACTPEAELNGIVGGNRVKPGSADSNTVVMLKISVKNGPGFYICTAAPIAPNILLTAGHCVDGDLSRAIVVLYTSISCESGYNQAYNSAPVSDFVVHPEFDLEKSEYDVANMKGDIALVILKENLPLNYPIYKIADPLKLDDTNQIYFYGYGRQSESQGGAGILRKTDLPRSKFSVSSDDKKVYVDQSNGSGICKGDSGGPGLVKIDGEFQILGINSYVGKNFSYQDFCKGQSTLVLADSYRSWIELSMNRYGQNLKK